MPLRARLILVTLLGPILMAPGGSPHAGATAVGGCDQSYRVTYDEMLQAMATHGAYNGGATATQVRVGDPWFLFPVALGVMAWAGLWCRSARIRALLPLMS